MCIPSVMHIEILSTFAPLITEHVTHRKLLSSALKNHNVPHRKLSPTISWHSVPDNSAQTIAKHYSRILSQWPKDLVRPEVQFQKVIQARATKASTLAEGQETAELRNVNALYSLLSNRYSKKVLILSSLPSNLKHEERINQLIRSRSTLYHQPSSVQRQTQHITTTSSFNSPKYPRNHDGPV